MKRFPCLSEWLSSLSWEDGSPRVLPTLVLFVGDGRLKACLNDKDEQLVGFVTVDSLPTLLASLERLLADDGVEWRASSAKVARSPRKSS